MICLFFLFSPYNFCRHRVLAELLEHGLRSNLVLPEHKPLLPSSDLTVSQTVARPTEYESARSLGINPSHALHHPGFYYYVAARCTELRRKRFLAAVEAEVCLLSGKELQLITLTSSITNRWLFLQVSRMRKGLNIWQLLTNCIPKRMSCSRSFLHHQIRVKDVWPSVLHTG